MPFQGIEGAATVGIYLFAKGESGRVVCKMKENDIFKVWVKR
jgi:hypothetical protein